VCVVPAGALFVAVWFARVLLLYRLLLSCDLFVGVAFALIFGRRDTQCLVALSADGVCGSQCVWVLLLSMRVSLRLTLDACVRHTATGFGAGSGSVFGAGVSVQSGVPAAGAGGFGFGVTAPAAASAVAATAGGFGGFGMAASSGSELQSPALTCCLWLCISRCVSPVHMCCHVLSCALLSVHLFAIAGQVSVDDCVRVVCTR